MNTILCFSIAVIHIENILEQRRWPICYITYMCVCNVLHSAPFFFYIRFYCCVFFFLLIRPLLVFHILCVFFFAIYFALLSRSLSFCVLVVCVWPFFGCLTRFRLREENRFLWHLSTSLLRNSTKLFEWLHVFFFCFSLSFFACSLELKFYFILNI